jgi:hypothetical protein
LLCRRSRHRAGRSRSPAAGLKAIADQLGPSTYLHELALGLARTASVAPVRVPLHTVAGTIAPQPGGAGTAPIAADVQLAR